ncbi:hypothetical protein MMC29_003884 [Sticta canariensis]|nr:hypothetical protein [Sticta canariensis]
MSFAPPVSRDGFHYNGDLYVEVGNLNRHKRASVAEIRDLLRPDLKKSNKIPGKDAFGHWYEAQLIHYGLPPSKDKARAKMRLLEALNASALVVPRGIVTLEESLRKEYDVAERKAKALYKASTATSAEKQGGSKKRKQADAFTSHGPTVNVNVNIGGFGASAYGEFQAQQQESPPLKKARTPVAKAPTQKPVANRAKKSPNTDTKTKGTPMKAKVTKKDPPVKKSAVAKTQTPTKKMSADKEPATKKETAIRKQTAIKKEPTVNKQTAIESVPSIKKEPTVKKQTVIKSVPSIKKEPAVKKETAVRSGPTIKNEPGDNGQSLLGLINGYYDIECPSLESEFDSDHLSLILCLETPRVWGAYDFGQFSGILHLPQRPYHPSEDPLPFHWRGRENGEGEMSFGEDCFGEIAFLGGGKIEGRIMNLYGDCGFTGMRRPGPTVAPRSANSMREEWEGYSEESYERERVGRWGGW